MNIDKHLPELRRAIRNHKYEFTQDGVLVPNMGLHAGFLFETTVNGKDRQVTPNMVPKQGRVYLLSAALNLLSPTAFYIMPYTADATPAEDWTAANFESKATEFTGYESAVNRLQWNRTLDGSGGSKAGNAADPADFELSAGQTDVTFYGFGLSTAQAKSSNQGVLISATRHVRPGLNAGDNVSVRLTLEYKNAA